MVVALFPLAKIGILLMKQLSKPIANIIKNEAKKHPIIRKNIIVPLGKAYQWVEFKATKRGSKETLPEEELVELGANAVGEIVLFGILTLILMAEINRQGDKKAIIERRKEEEIVNLQDFVLELNDDLSEIKNQIDIIIKRLETPPNVFELEEERHVQVLDHDFWDVMSGIKSEKDSKIIDKSSPSI